MEQKTLFTSALVVVKNNRLLLAFSKNKNAWYLPGGKVDEGETAIQSLVREISEELNIHLIPEQLEFYCHITAPAFGEANNLVMEQDCFFYPLETDAIKPGNEIGEVHFFDFETYRLEREQVPGVLQLFNRLFKDGIINKK
ncbi:NUDIX hydrolase [Polluticaenibacter yanchengensis]|uniref:NUDIX domain-containing protein n=1 Tax=Polluticaenibacter yanchengensis TaxID=3014562 RepID=A0ABT4UGD1_9BACT|nr:NUDIX domain-containing protein [Chitinophagaceae bacterium LY-5]